MSGSGGLFHVQRPRRDHSAEYEYAKDLAGRQLEFNEPDARAVVAILNDFIRQAIDRTRARRSDAAERRADSPPFEDAGAGDAG